MSRSVPARLAALLASALLVLPAAAQDGAPKQDHDAAGRATAPTVGRPDDDAGGGPRPVDRAHPRPALSEIPVPPGRTTPPEGHEPAPLPRGLARNDFVADRFTAPGQSVEYAFQARAGELSLFELATWGYQRSWNSALAVRILGPDGRRLAAARRAGETAYRCFLPFVAPADGVYRIALESVEEYFRYTLVRHSDYPAATGGPVPFAGRATTTDAGLEVFRGYLATPDDVRTVRLDVEAGEELALSVLNDHPTGRRQKEMARKPGGPGDVRDAKRGRGGRDGAPGGRGGDDESAPEGRAARGMGGARGGGDAPTADFPDLVLTVRRGGEVVAGPGHFVLFTPESSGACDVEVTATSRGEGGLFALALERAPERVEVSGYVGDEADDPVPGVAVAFFRQPGSDPVGRAVSGEDGDFALTVLPGDYVLRVQREGGPRTEHVQVNIPRARAVNLVWTADPR